MTELYITARSVSSLGPVISDTEGPLGADTTFSGFVIIHLREPDDRPDEKSLIAYLHALKKRHPARCALLYKWDATHDERELRRYLLSTDTKIILARNRSP